MEMLKKKCFPSYACNILWNSQWKIFGKSFNFSLKDYIKRVRNHSVIAFKVYLFIFVSETISFSRKQIYL